ncbi:MAG: hypothetical protein AAGG08_05035, partial [Actinomycetota bacterium]
DGLVGLAEPLADEVPRTTLIESLGRRWAHRLVVIEAPGGYGKSTLVAQAIRDNASDPSGLDVAVRCRRTHRSVRDLLADVATTLATTLPTTLPTTLATADASIDRCSTRDLIEMIAAELARRSPTSVCLWLDDAHVLADLAIEQATDDVAELLDRIPANAHLAVVGRRLPPLPISRLVRSGECIVVDEHELLFDAHEQRAIAERHGIDPAVIAASEGWPALTRLALTNAEPNRTSLFAESLASMSTAEREAVAIAQISGGVTDDLLAACGIDCDLRRMVRRTPLLDRFADGTVMAHDLWADTDTRLVTDERRAELAHDVGRHLAETDAGDQAIDVALRHQLWDLAETLVLDALADGDGGLDAARARRWLESFPHERRARGELLLLEGVVLGLEHGPRAGVEQVQQSVRHLDDDHRITGQCAALMDLGTRAWAVGDAGIVAPCFDLIPGLLALGAPQVTELVGRQQAVDADLAGDFERAIELHRALPVLDLALRHQATLELIVGNGERSDELVDELVERYPTDFNRRVRALHRFAHGDPSGVLHPDFPSLDVVRTQRDVLLQTIGEIAVRSARGDTLDIGPVRDAMVERSRERMFQAVAEVFLAVSEHCDDDAALLFDRALDEAGDDPIVPGELRRFLSLAHVLSPHAREILDTAPLRGHHVTMRSLCQALLLARTQPSATIGSLPSAREVFCYLPLSWSVELACLLAARDDPRAPGLLDELAALAGTNTQRELRWRADRSGQHRRGAKALLATVPVPPTTPAHITLFGDPSVRHGDDEVEVTRPRLRQVIALLLLRRRVDRTVIAEVIWPDDDPVKVGNRLRVTLSQLRTTIDPDRSTSEASFRMREHDGSVTFAESEWFTSDVWRLRALLDRPASLDVSREAIGIIRPGLADDVLDLPELAAEYDALVVQTVARHATVGEQLLADGDADGAAEIAEELLGVAPLLERAAALSIAAHLGRRDDAAARTAVDRCRALLAQLDVDPSPTTAMLIRRVERRAA